MTHDWTLLYKKYKGLWVALLPDEKTVVGNGKKAHDALKVVQKKGYQDPILTRVPDSLATFVGCLVCSILHA